MHTEIHSVAQAIKFFKRNSEIVFFIEDEKGLNLIKLSPFTVREINQNFSACAIFHILK